MRLPAMAERKPAELSGALDLLLHMEMQIELKHLQTQVGITFVYVTHDQDEALAMSDRIAVMHDGRVLQVDAPAALYERPATRFVASFVGETNFLSAKVLSNSDGSAVLAVGADRLAVATDGFQPPAGQGVTLAVRPERLRLARTGQPAGEWVLAGIVHEAVYIGSDTRYVVALPGGEMVVARLQNTSEHGPGAFAAGEAVQVWCAPQDARLLAE